MWDNAQHKHDRNGPFYGARFSQDMAETMRNGSLPARRRARLLSRLLMLAFVALPASVYLSSWIFGW